MKTPRTMFFAVILACASSQTLAASEQDVVASYVELAHTVYSDSLQEAQQLKADIDAFLAKPSQQSLQTAKQAWLQARIPYQQSEAFRFGNPVVDNWEGQLNAWPLDEGFIDYVSPDYQGELGNTGATANIVAATQLQLGANHIDLSTITPELLASLNELGGSEANVATGYHAIEFLLWGQDLNGTEAGAGERSFTDYLSGAHCTNGNCQRRKDYLAATAQLLIDDLTYMVDQWSATSKDNYRQLFLQLPEQEAVTRILFSMGSLALGELAGERMRVALEANSSEDEHDCFSDNTHFAHYYDWKGISNVFQAEYTSSQGKSFKGDSLADLLAEKNPQLAKKMAHQMAQTNQAIYQLVTMAEDKTSPMKFDQMIAEGNTKGAAAINNAIAELTKTTELIEQTAKVLGITNLTPNFSAGL
ncbi:imelysin family protein [Halioxenophilus aromaticivorans]|uniref:Imelysin family protein n=1 Tax=Halioxenophilus aromaticivorans TaxID=1306992 RepID=A0AAV3TYH2_9ALTE